MKSFLCLFLLVLVSMVSTMKIDFSEEDLEFKIRAHVRHSATAEQKRVYQTLRRCDPEEIKRTVSYPRHRDLLMPRYGWRSIHVAAAYCGPEIMKLFQNAGVDLNTRSIDGETPFLVAYLHYNYKTWLFLARSKAVQKDAVTNNNWGILHFMAIGRSAKGLESVLNQNPDLAIDTPGGNRKLTPLMIAIMKKNVKTVGTLLAKGASLLVTDNQGINAEILAHMIASRSPVDDVSSTVLLMVSK